MSRFTIAPDIHKSPTLPASFYRDASLFKEVSEKIFSRTWLYVADANVVANPGDVYPFIYLEGVLDEPLVLTRNKVGEIFCLSNVCTHRGKIIVEEKGNKHMLSCGYHGRCFRLDGTFKSMPEFEKTENFPSEKDHLAKIPIREWMGLLFISLDPAFSFDEAIQPVKDRVGWMPTDKFIFEKSGTKNYFIKANWALYCDNYLEGFHIPFVHPALNNAIEFEQYDYELYPYCNLQLGIAKENEPCFNLPKNSIDSGKRIYAYYFWLFPNLMFNFYPWGLSLNSVEPLSYDRTKVSFRSYRFENQSFNNAVHNLENTEMEDEAVVESVQMGVKSRFYHSGRFSPTMEKNVHHFHKLINDFLS